jgi:hypothetical protein
MTKNLMRCVPIIVTLCIVWSMFIADAEINQTNINTGAGKPKALDIYIG